MAKQRTAEFENWCGGASDSELRKTYWKLVLRQFIYALFWIGFLMAAVIIGITVENLVGIVICLVLSGVSMGCYIFCYNNACYIKSRGHKMGNNLSRGILVIFGLIVVPIIVVNIASKVEAIGHLISGL